MSGIRAAYARQHAIVARKMGADIALAFAAVLPADQHVDELLRRPRKQPEARDRARKDGRRLHVVIRYDPVGDAIERPAFQRAAPSRIARGALSTPAFVETTIATTARKCARRSAWRSTSTRWRTFAKPGRKKRD